MKYDSFDAQLMITNTKMFVSVMCLMGCHLEILIENCQGDRKKQAT